MTDAALTSKSVLEALLMGATVHEMWLRTLPVDDTRKGYAKGYRDGLKRALDVMGSSGGDEP